MTPDRTRAVLQQIADRVPRDALHGQSLRSLCMRDLVRRRYVMNDKGFSIRYRLTKAGRAMLAPGQTALSQPDL